LADFESSELVIRLAWQKIITGSGQLNPLTEVVDKAELVHEDSWLVVTEVKETNIINRCL